MSSGPFNSRFLSHRSDFLIREPEVHQIVNSDCGAYPASVLFDPQDIQVMPNAFIAAVIGSEKNTGSTP